MTENIAQLLSRSSEALGLKPVEMPEFLGAYALGPQLFDVLHARNGFYAFLTALHVFPITGDIATGLEAWNAVHLWRDQYADVAKGLLFFAEDVFQDQFCLSVKQAGVYRFHAETGQTTFMAETAEDWAGLILSNHRAETGWPLLEEWQRKFGPLPLGKRLMPKTPFFLGGEYTIENLWAGNPLEGMRLKADLATQTRHLGEGAKIKLNITPKPQ